MKPWSFYATPKPGEVRLFYLASAGQFDFRYPAVPCQRPHGHSVEHLWYTVAGGAQVEIAGQRILATPGSLCFTPKDCSYSAAVSPGSGFWEGRWLEFDGAWARPLRDMFGLRGRYHIPDFTEGGMILEELFSLLQARGNDALHPAAALVWKLFAAAEQAGSKDGSGPDRTRRSLELVQKYIQDHLSQSLDLASLARLAGRSPFHFSRVFKTRTGFSPMAYVTARRIARARELFRQGGLSVKEVGAAVGIPEIHHFSLVFKRIAGMSPRHFIRSFSKII
jgi:AraC-like DNA-binding protein